MNWRCWPHYSVDFAAPAERLDLGTVVAKLRPPGNVAKAGQTGPSAAEHARDEPHAIHFNERRAATVAASGGAFGTQRDRRAVDDTRVDGRETRQGQERR